ITRVAENVGGSPKQLHTGFLLLLFGIFHDGLHSAFVFFYVFAFIDQIDIMKAVIRRTDFSDEFKSRIHFIFGTLQGILRLIPLMHHRTWAEGITACSTEGMPVGDGEAKMLLHSFACYDFILIIKFES